MFAFQLNSNSQHTMWKVLFLVSYCVSAVRSDQKKPLNSIYVNAVRCNFSEKYVFKNVSCFAKSFSRNFSTINVIATFKRPMMNFFVSFFWQVVMELVYIFLFFFQFTVKLFYRYGTIFREVINSPMVDICSIVTPSFTNIWVKMVRDLIYDTTPGSMHECPYSVRM